MRRVGLVGPPSTASSLSPGREISMKFNHIANRIDPSYFENGLPPVPDFHGGDTNFKSIDYLSIPLPVMQTLNALVIVARGVKKDEGGMAA